MILADQEEEEEGAAADSGHHGEEEGLTRIAMGMTRMECQHQCHHNAVIEPEGIRIPSHPEFVSRLQLQTFLQLLFVVLD